MSAHPIKPNLFVVFGGTGDLMHRKLLPALYHLMVQGAMDECMILGVARGEQDDERYRSWARAALQEAGFASEALTPWCDRCLRYYTIGNGEAEDYQGLADWIATLEQKRELSGNRVFYLALPPVAFPATIEGVGQTGLPNGPGWTRLVVEKPFGRDLESACDLNRLIHRYFDESQVYRIDHYLGKETVQNLMAFRFANSVFEFLWNRDRIESVQITVAEDLGLEGRAGYYDQAGALRDMVQSHLTQLLTLIAMEPSSAFEADTILHEKVKVLRALPSIRPENVVFGQYARGKLNSTEVIGYREEEGVDADSETETFVAMRMAIDTWRWKGVPFYLRTGKRLPRKRTEIVVTFRYPPICLFQQFDTCDIQANMLRITLQPNEGFAFCFKVKVPGKPFMVKTQQLAFQYNEVFGPLPHAYQTLLLDILQGDQTLFVRTDEVETAWQLYTPLLEQRPTVYPYAAGTWGPPEADRLFDREESPWLNP